MRMNNYGKYIVTHLGQESPARDKKRRTYEAWCVKLILIFSFDRFMICKTKKRDKVTVTSNVIRFKEEKEGEIGGERVSERERQSER